MMTSVYGAMAGLALVWPVRRMIMRRLSAKMAGMVRTTTPTMSVAIDDFAELERQPDGTLVSVVGWIRARQELPEAVGGPPSTGLALPCHEKSPGLLETLNDFDLVDEAGHTVLVQVTDARMLGATNV